MAGTQWRATADNLLFSRCAHPPGHRASHDDGEDMARGRAGLKGRQPRSRGKNDHTHTRVTVYTVSQAAQPPQYGLDTQLKPWIQTTPPTFLPATQGGVRDTGRSLLPSGAHLPRTLPIHHKPARQGLRRRPPPSAKHSRQVQGAAPESQIPYTADAVDRTGNPPGLKAALIIKVASRQPRYNL